MMSNIDKRMTENSTEVPTGAKLVWRLEQYVKEASGGNWVPASGISYVVWEGGGKTPDSPQEGPPEPVSDRIETTGEDGRIILYKTDHGYPSVSFIENQVYLNLNSPDELGSDGDDDGGGMTPPDESGGMMRALFSREEESRLDIPTGPILRLLEVPEQSDTEWGMLAGYWGYNQQNKQPEYGLNIDCNDARGFVNSNKMGPVEVEKRMSVQSDQQFTMILKQVVSLGGDIRNLIEVGPEEFEGYDNWVAEIRNCVTETQPRGNISYTIHNADGSIAGKAVTGANGEIKL